ncbi:hypothetical protein HNQ59_003399 [Chitinivorax tropicus]|uniref:Uncharacterized protein n=1 Tax=Chitinivorax tropicus TaxID=714531 RepID=A0A840MUP8_9PROT|nr:hypothetical protein [Chitinivorax tropicus]MBB5020086.1 hypothetical protein [Chitinivorax tropicus]
MGISKKPALFAVSFDINQNSQNLIWRVTSADHRDALRTRGRSAGLLKLHENEILNFTITGGCFQTYFFDGQPHQLKSFDFRILQAGLISTPKGPYKDNDGDIISQNPSMLANSNSILLLDTNEQEWQTSYNWQDDDGGIYLEVEKSYLQQLQITDKVGFWELSFVLNVEITRTALINGQVHTFSEVRSFAFDPESEVGNGTHR